MPATTTAHHPTNLDHALTYARQGWRVVPVPPGRKVPTITAWQREGTTDEARIRHWWTNSPDHGIGIVCGPASGLWVLDVDIADGKHGDDTLQDLIDAYGPLPATHEVITGSGGRHYYFAWDPTADIRNSASGTLGPGLDVRGEGGFVVAPPSLHANGQRYETEASAPTHLTAAPAWLLALLTAAPDAPTHRPNAPSSRSDRPGDAWADTTTWDQLLTADGWTKMRPGPEGEDRWCRPGKDPREGPSATVGYGGSDVLKVFTSSHPQLQADETYTKFGYLATTQFNGDMSAARRWCSDQGHGGHGDARDLIDGDTPPALPAAPAPWPDPEPWPQPTPLPPFPLHTLPEWAQAHTVAAADARQVPVDMTAMLAIGALSAAATGRATIHPNPGWAEPVNLYLVVAMRSGAGKSPAEKAMAGWIRRWERERMAAMAPAHDEATILARLAEKKYKKLSEGGLADGGDVLEAARLAQAAKDNIPPLPRLIIDDTTPEAVATLLAAHGERLAILSTEADLFDSLMKGNANQRASMIIYLKAWSGDELRRDRKGGSETGPEATVLEHPLLSVSVTVQPAILARMLTDDEMSSRGFAARFMFSMPADLMGQRDQRRRFRSGDMGTAETYEATARDLATRWSRWARPAKLHLDPQAADLFENLLVELEPRLAVGADLEALAEWVAKLTASVARYAGLLHLAEHGDPETEVDAATMARAIDLGHYWLAHAIGVKGEAEEVVVRQAKAIIEWVASQGVGQVTVAAIHRGVRRPGGEYQLDKVADYIPPIEILIHRGWLRWEGIGDWRTNVGVPRSPSPTLHVLPAVVGNSLRARNARSARSACMGERESLFLPYTHTPQQGHAPRALRAYPDQPPGSMPVDNPTEGGAVDNSQPPDDPLDWSTWTAPDTTKENP